MTLYVSLTADGRVAQAQASGGIPPIILQDLMGLVGQSGAMVIGRLTYEVFHGMGAIGSIPGAVVVVSESLGDTAGVTVASTPQAALHALSRLGVAGAVLCGGAKTYEAFLALDAVDEARINITPLVMGQGASLASLIAPLPLELISAGELGDGIVQLRYRRAG